MRALGYSFRQGGASLLRSAGSGAFAVLAISLAMIVLGALLLLTSNGERLLARWSSAAEFSVYLRDDATSEDRGAIEALIDQSGVALARQYVSKADALTHFRREFAELASLASAFEDNPFPASVEVRLKPEAESNGRAASLVQRLASAAGVADVGYDRDWLGRIAGMLRTVRAVGLTLATLMALAAAVTVATVVRLGLHARRAELEIMELVGAPLAFIRGPFVAEGLLQGGIGSVIALVLLWAGFAVVVSWWGTDIRTILGDANVQFLPLRMVAFLLAGGMMVGSVGGFVAARQAGPR
jgi:cell division transport system permease protein